jgi:hypothetical protein
MKNWDFTNDQKSQWDMGLENYTFLTRPSRNQKQEVGRFQKRL